MIKHRNLITILKYSLILSLLLFVFNNVALTGIWESLGFVNNSISNGIVFLFEKSGEFNGIPVIIQVFRAESEQKRDQEYLLWEAQYKRRSFSVKVENISGILCMSAIKNNEVVNYLSLKESESGCLILVFKKDYGVKKVSKSQGFDFQAILNKKPEISLDMENFYLKVFRVAGEFSSNIHTADYELKKVGWEKIPGSFSVGNRISNGIYQKDKEILYVSFCLDSENCSTTLTAFYSK